MRAFEWLRFGIVGINDVNPTSAPAPFEWLRFGIVGINDVNPTSAPAPFGGMKESD